MDAVFWSYTSILHLKDLLCVCLNYVASFPKDNRLVLLSFHRNGGFERMIYTCKVHFLSNSSNYRHHNLPSIVLTITVQINIVVFIVLAIIIAIFMSIVLEIIFTSSSVSSSPPPPPTSSSSFSSHMIILMNVLIIYLYFAIMCCRHRPADMCGGVAGMCDLWVCSGRMANTRDEFRYGVLQHDWWHIWNCGM